MAADMERAQAEFEKLCQTFEEEGWKIQKDEEKLVIECSARGEDLTIDLHVQVDADRELIYLLSKMPFTVADDKRIDMVIAVSMVNDILVHGCFDFDVNSGRMFFRMTNSYKDSSLGYDLYKYLIYCSCQTIDEYNDKLLMLSTGILDMDAFIKLMNEE